MSPFYLQKFEKLHYGLWRLWTAITRAALKSDAGVVEQFNSVVKICLRPTLVATVTKISDF